MPSQRPTLNGHPVLRQVGTALLLELLENVLDERDIEILSTEMRVTVCRLHFENALLHLQDRDIKSASTEIVDGDDAGVGPVHAVSKSGSGGLVDDSKDLETSNLSGILRCLSLRIIEVRRHSDDGMALGKNKPVDVMNNIARYSLDLLI